MHLPGKSTLFALLLGSFATFATGQTSSSLKLFGENPPSPSGLVVDPQQAWTFGSSSPVVVCSAGDTARISGSADGTAPFVVDNFITLNGADICEGPLSNQPIGNPVPVCFMRFLEPSNNVGLSYVPVPPVDITDHLVRGEQLLDFQLKDIGVIKANSDIYLTTTCRITTDVAICHKPGTPAQMPLFVPPTALPGHLGHGDTLGTCADHRIHKKN